ncbi:MAG: glycosyltransferase family 4 protein [Bacteroidetes bacterium]|nr:glycosyltransferase family 4 protein [Bacteroidota bacterium]
MKKNLQILHLATAKSWRGGEQQVAWLAGELQWRGVSQWVFCPAGSKMEAHCREQGIGVFTFRKIFNLNPLVAWQIRRLCNRHGITHLHAHDSHAHTFAVLAATWFRNPVPVIAHRRVDFPIGQSFLSRWKYNHPAVRRIVCVSDFIKKLIEPDIRQPEKLAVVHSGIDLGRFDFSDKKLNDKKLRREFSIPGGHFLIANVAAIAPHKDYFTFAKTAEILLRQGFPATFLAIGSDGGEVAAVRRFIEEKKLEGQVILTGFRADVPEILPELDLLLFTSKTEGLGTSLLDAFACGVPVVATATGGIPEVVEHGVTGLLAPVGDAGQLASHVQKVLTDSVLRKKLTANARCRVQDFTKGKMAEAVLKIYETV